MIYEFGAYRLDVEQRRLWLKQQEVSLRPKLFDLLTVFVQRRGKILDYEELLQTVWHDIEVEENNLTVSVNALRRVLGDSEYIENVSRRGYRFNAEVKVAGTPQNDTIAPPGGAVPLPSPLYIKRETDDEFCTAIERQDSIVLVKGARQVGKTSLLARGLQKARETGATVVMTDFQQLNESGFETVEKLLLTIAEQMADRLELEPLPHQSWNNFLSPSSNFERFIRRQVLNKISAPLVWGLDEVDRLFLYPYASEVFGLFRSWHNLRALDPTGPWSRFTLALAYATEAHLFITDLNQSPFNVGTRLTLEDFTLEQIRELNIRYQSPLKNEEEIERYFALVGGHPYLAQRGLYEMVNRQFELAVIIFQAGQEEGIFGDHLRRMKVSLERDRLLLEALREVVNEGAANLSTDNFYRLRSAGVLTGASAQEAKPRCELYTQYLKTHLE